MSDAYGRYTQRAFCPKCGHDDISTDYDKPIDVLKRTCRRCCYDWNEQPLDAPPPIIRGNVNPEPSGQEGKQ